MKEIDRRDGLRLIAAGLAGLAMTAHGDDAPASAPPRAPAPASAAAMLARPIPSSGEMLPVIGLGSWQTFDVGGSAAERAPLEAVLARFAESGGRLVDSSPMYGRSERVVGEIAAKLGLHPRLFIATKVWTSGRRAGIEQMEDSIRKLRHDPIDLMQVHNLVDVDTHLDTLDEWKRQGRVRHVGITHYTAGAQEAVARIVAARRLDFIQINYSVGERDAERRLLPLARERGVAVIANRPFGGGGLLRRLASRPLPAWAADIDCGSWAQLLLKFVVSHPALTCAIPATSKLAHVDDNLRAGYGAMPDESMRTRIAAAAA